MTFVSAWLPRRMLAVLGGPVRARRAREILQALVDTLPGLRRRRHQVPPQPDHRTHSVLVGGIALPWSIFWLYPVFEAVGYGEMQRDTARYS